MLQDVLRDGVNTGPIRVREVELSIGPIELVRGFVNPPESLLVVFLHADAFEEKLAAHEHRESAGVPVILGVQLIFPFHDLLERLERLSLVLEVFCRPLAVEPANIRIEGLGRKPLGLVYKLSLRPRAPARGRALELRDVVVRPLHRRVRRPRAFIDVPGCHGGRAGRSAPPQSNDAENIPADPASGQICSAFPAGTAPPPRKHTPPRAPPASTPGGDGRPQRAMARARAERAARAPPQAREQAPGARRDAIASPVAASPASAPRRASSSSRARRTKRKRSERRRRRRRRSPSPSPALRDRTRKRARSRGITSTPRTARTSRPCGRRSRRSSSSADRAAGRARARSVITLHWSPYDRVGVVNAVS